MKYFISYSRSVKQEVGKVVALLRAAGHGVWWDGDIPIIADWWATILDNIERCEVSIFVVSEKSVQSAYCLAELKYSTDRNRPILPFVIDDHTKYTIPPEVTPMRNQWFEYEGDPAQMLREILDASGKIQWTHYPDVPVPRPPEPNTGSGSLVKQFQQAVSLAEDGHLDEAVKRFRKIGSLDFEEWGEDCQNWVTQLQLYAPIAELADHKATLVRARKKWDNYLKTYDSNFDPLGIRVKLTTNSLTFLDSFPFASILQNPSLTFTPLAQTETQTPSHVEDILPPPFEWIEIPGGKVLLEEGGYLSKASIFDVPTFTIAKYPITNAQYQIFADSRDGYYDSQWWDYSRDARSWRKYNPDAIDTAFLGEDHPRTNICWYEAIAFCRWLSKKTALQITLPTEQQWQRAALGDTKWEYPWGDRFYNTRGNVSEARTTPVTRYPKGASPYGVMDMSGNVAELCLNSSGNGNLSIGKKAESSVIVRGGGWGMPAEYVTAKDREDRGVLYRYNDLGFRIVHNY